MRSRGDAIGVQERQSRRGKGQSDRRQKRDKGGFSWALVFCPLLYGGALPARHSHRPPHPSGGRALAREGCLCGRPTRLLTVGAPARPSWRRRSPLLLPLSPPLPFLSPSSPSSLRAGSAAPAPLRMRRSVRPSRSALPQGEGHRFLHATSHFRCPVERARASEESPIQGETGPGNQGNAATRSRPQLVALDSQPEVKTVTPVFLCLQLCQDQDTSRIILRMSSISFLSPSHRR